MGKFLYHIYCDSAHVAQTTLNEYDHFYLNLQMNSNERKKRLSYSSFSRKKAKSCGNFQGKYIPKFEFSCRTSLLGFCEKQVIFKGIETSDVYDPGMS